MTSAPRWATAPTVPVRFLRELFAAQGLAPAIRDAALGRAGLRPRALDDDGFRASPVTFGRLLRAAIRAGDDELLGHAARKVPPGAYARLLHFLVHCPDIATALDEAAALYRLFDGAAPWTVDVAGPVARLRLTLQRPVQRGSLLYAHMMLLTLWQTAGWLGGADVALRRVLLPAEFAAYANEARFLFGRAPEFGDQAGMDWPRGVLAAPVGRRRDEIAAFLRRAPGGMTAPGQPATIEAQLRLMLAAADPFAALREDEAARALGLSRQTLARRLAALGTSYQGIREALRRDRACTLLARGDRSLAEIADMLGYSEP